MDDTFPSFFWCNKPDGGDSEDCHNQLQMIKVVFGASDFGDIGNLCECGDVGR